MNLLKIEKYRMVMGQLTVVWIAISLLAPILYFGYRKVKAYDENLARYEKIEQRIKASIGSLSDEQIDAFYKEGEAQKKKENILRRLAFIIFEVVSITGLLVYRQKKKALIALLEANETQRFRSGSRNLRELIPFP